MLQYHQNYDNNQENMITVMMKIKKICAVLPLSLPAGSNLALRTHFRGSKLEYPMIMIIVMRMILIIVIIIIDNQLGSQDDYDCSHDDGDNTGQGTIMMMVKIMMMTMMTR